MIRNTTAQKGFLWNLVPPRRCGHVTCHVSAARTPHIGRAGFTPAPDRLICACRSCSFRTPQTRDCVLTSHDSHDPNAPRPARRAGRRRGDRTAAEHRALDPAGHRRHRARAGPRPAAHRARARTGAARHPAAADLFGGRRHELARVPLQPAADLAARLRLRRLHDLRGGGGGALCARPAVGGRLPARRDRGAARRGRTARDRAAARHAAPASWSSSKAKASPTTRPR